MINEQSILAVIPARGGSKGVPRKNIRMMKDKPLIAWTIDSAKRSKYIDRLIVSTEDNEIMQIANMYECETPFVRPSELAQDHSVGTDVIIHAIKTLEPYDWVVVLQPTCPLRETEDIDACIEFCMKHDAPCCVSVTAPEKSPYWMYTLDNKNRLKAVIEKGAVSTMRQELPEVYALNGAVYVARTSWFLERKSFLTEDTIAFEMPKKRSYDIDTEDDFRICEFLLMNK